MKENFEENMALPTVTTGRSGRKKIVKATVVNCNRLNVRNAAEPDAAVVGVISPTDHVKVNLEESVDGYYRIIEPFYGFAIKKFLEVK